MLDQLSEERPGAASRFLQNLYVSFRGSAKTTALHEYMYLYLATYGGIKGIGPINVAMYISDTMENGVKSMRNNLEFRWNNSEFLQKYVPYTRFTDVRWEFKNADGKRLTVRGFGATTGVRGFKEYGERPTWCGMDDLMSDKNAESATIIRDIKTLCIKLHVRQCTLRSVLLYGRAHPSTNQIRSMKLPAAMLGTFVCTLFVKNSRALNKNLKVLGKIDSLTPLSKTSITHCWRVVKSALSTRSLC